MTAEKININPIPWYDNIEHQNHRNFYAYGDIYKFVSERAKIPPFQLASSTFTTIASFKIVNWHTGTETDVTSQLVSHGYIEQSFPDYKLIIYPGILIFTGSWAAGPYYCIMTDDNSNEFFSEIFYMATSVADCLKIEYWHNEDFYYPGGHIQYVHPYKNFFHICTDIGFPEYKRYREISERNQKQFILKSVTWKEFNFNFPAPEFLIDALLRIEQHDNVIIHKNGIQYDVELFTITPTWIQRGDIASIDVNFRIDTETVIFGQSYNEIEYSAESCGCLPGGSFSAKSLLLYGSTDYNNFTYNDQYGNPQLLEINDKVLIEDLSGSISLLFFNGSGYTPYYDSYDDFANVCVSNTQEYYFANSLFEYVQTSIIGINVVGVNTWEVYGETFDNVQVNIYTKDAGGTETLSATGTADEFNGSGIEFTAAGAVAVQVRIFTLNCSDIQSSSWELLSGFGIGWMTIETTNIIG